MPCHIWIRRLNTLSCGSHFWIIPTCVNYELSNSKKKMDSTAALKAPYCHSFICFVLFPLFKGFFLNRRVLITDEPTIYTLMNGYHPKLFKRINRHLEGLITDSLLVSRPPMLLEDPTAHSWRVQGSRRPIIKEFRRLNGLQPKQLARIRVPSH